MSWGRTSSSSAMNGIVECDAEQAAEAKAWLEKAMIEAMEAVLNGTDEVCVPVEAWKSG